MHWETEGAGGYRGRRELIPSSYPLSSLRWTLDYRASDSLGPIHNRISNTRFFPHTHTHTHTLTPPSLGRSKQSIVTMSLRLLPAFAMDNDDDDDGNFTNWMSSYWGHGSEGHAARENKRSFRKTSRSQTDRRASLPCVSQLDAVRLSRLHAGALGASASVHSSRPGGENRDGARPPTRARRASSDEISRAHVVIPESRIPTIPTIPELTESFDKRFSLGKKTQVSLNESDSVCLICAEELRSGRTGVLEVHCKHRFHREASRHGRLRSSSSAAAECDAWRSAKEECRRASKETDCLMPHRQFSLRRHR
ncbi:leukemia NUP98 fusion partner 1 [Gadus morhua]|uniref:leukemia NUP98 fusion partner 1 n=1 Tax=Gadus morhua TaxID=8049 RepID=UPI0011B630B7|nr:leukemia NUP98 fusion partner 1 [Gadus morhua]